MSLRPTHYLDPFFVSHHSGFILGNSTTIKLIKMILHTYMVIDLPFLIIFKQT